ncbi:MAG: DUF6108 family protein [Bacteroidaceae bacterium]|nr:DUF6108 family protein [Bacteroidaceae bacterium]
MMNRTITTILVMLCVSLCAFAQKGLRINDVFEGKVILKSKMQESLIKGDNLASYNLKVLHTVKFTTPFKLRREEVEKLFYEDMENRLSDDDENMELETRNGHLYYAIVQLSDTEKGAHRYICYQCRDKSGDYDITLVYMEGKASLADLRRTFKKNNK